MGPNDNRSLVAWADEGPLALVLTRIVPGAMGRRPALDAARLPAAKAVHAAQADLMIRQRDGCIIRSTETGVLAVFKVSATALEFAREIHGNPGSDLHGRVAAVVHCGTLELTDSDPYSDAPASVAGPELRSALRVIDANRRAALWITEAAKAEIEGALAATPCQLEWTAIRTQRGLPPLWSLNGDRNQTAPHPVEGRAEGRFPLPKGVVAGASSVSSKPAASGPALWAVAASADDDGLDPVELGDETAQLISGYVLRLDRSGNGYLVRGQFNFHKRVSLRTARTVIEFAIRRYFVRVAGPPGTLSPPVPVVRRECDPRGQPGRSRRAAGRWRRHAAGPGATQRDIRRQGDAARRRRQFPLRIG